MDVLERPGFNECFQEVCCRHPDVVALEAPGVALTYRELWTQAVRVAGELRQGGLGPEAIVALGLEKSVEYVVSLLGV